MTLPSSPQLPLPPIPTHPQAGLDPEGLWYDLKHYDGIIHDFYDAFPSELAFQYCSWNGSEKLPGGVYFGPKFVFDESTSINGPTDTPTPVSAVGKMTTEPPETPSTQTPLPVTSAIPIGSQSINFSANPSATIAILPNGQTVEAGHTISVEGTPIFLPPSGTAIIVGSATVALNPAQPTQPPSITIGTKVAPVSFALGQTGVLLPNSGTLLPGSTTYIDGTTFSLDSSGTAIIADGTSIPLSGTAVPFPPVTAPGGIILPGDTTLLPGSSTVVSGTTYSADPTGVLVVNIGTSVMTVTPGEGTDSATGTATMGEGVWSGMGGGPRSKTAAAVGMHGLLHIWVGVAVIGARVLTIVL